MSELNWSAISAVADALGAVGVIITVIYLAIQIRHNTRSVEASTEQTLMSQEIDVYTFVADNASVFRRGRESLSSLDADEQVVFQHLVMAEMSQFYSGFVQFERGLIPLPVWDAYRRGAAWELRDKGFQDSWNEVRVTYPEDFQAEVEALIRKDEVA